MYIHIHIQGKQASQGITNYRHVKGGGRKLPPKKVKKTILKKEEKDNYRQSFKAPAGKQYEYMYHKHVQAGGGGGGLPHKKKGKKEKLMKQSFKVPAGSQYEYVYSYSELSHQRAQGIHTAGQPEVLQAATGSGLIPNAILLSWR